MTGGQIAPTSPVTAKGTTYPYGSYDPPFNLPFLAASSGAVYVARWTTYHVRHVTRAIKEAILKRGFSFVEIISPCPTLYSRRNRLGDGLDQMKYYKESSEIRNGADTSEVEIEFQGKIVVGKFVDRERPTYRQMMNAHLTGVFGGDYSPYEG